MIDRVNAGCDQCLHHLAPDAGAVKAYGRIFSAVDRFLLAVKAVGETPTLAAERRVPDVKAATIGLLDRLVGGGESLQKRVGQHEQGSGPYAPDSNLCSLIFRLRLLFLPTV